MWSTWLGMEHLVSTQSSLTIVSNIHGVLLAQVKSSKHLECGAWRHGCHKCVADNRLWTSTTWPVERVARKKGGLNAGGGVRQQGRMEGERAFHKERATWANAQPTHPRASISVRGTRMWRLEGKTQGAHDRECSAVPGRATLEPAAKGKSSHTDPVLI